MNYKQCEKALTHWPLKTSVCSVVPLLWKKVKFRRESRQLISQDFWRKLGTHPKVEKPQTNFWNSAHYANIIILCYCACYYVYKTCIQLYLKVLSYKPVCLYTSLSLVQFCFHFTALCFCWAKFYYQPENTNCSTG